MAAVDDDQWGDSCNDYTVSGSPTHVGRGTDGTSCLFAENVLQTYLAQPLRFSGHTLRIDVASPRAKCPQAAANANPPPPTAILCSGDDFVMTCAPIAYASEPSWVDCRGGNRADVYLW